MWVNKVYTCISGSIKQTHLDLLPAQLLPNIVWRPNHCLLHDNSVLFTLKALPSICHLNHVWVAMSKLAFRRIVAVKTEKNIMLYQVQMWNCENEIDEEMRSERSYCKPVVPGCVSSFSSVSVKVTSCSLQAFALKVARTNNFPAFIGRHWLYSTISPKTDYET